jgi:hypothetical protein
MPDGRTCRATPLKDAPFCFWHSPDTADELAEARRTGGYHRRKKRTVATVFGFNGLRTIEDNQALLETVAVETLSLENSISRNTALTRMVVAGAKLIELRDLERRIEVLEKTLGDRKADEEVDIFGEAS